MDDQDLSVTISANPKDIAGRVRAPLHLVPPAALIHLSMAFKNGADKYGPYSWREKKIEYMSYLGACMRHIQAAIDGEDFDPESHAPTLAHAMACCAILLDAIESNCVIDNRPTKGNAREILQRIAKQGA